MPDLEVMPDAIAAYRAYLLELDELADLGGRIYYGELPKNPIFPAARITDISTTDAGRHWTRSLTQTDVWHSEGRLRDCRALAELIRAAYIASVGHNAAGWALGGVDDVNRSTTQPFGNGVDDSFEPPRPRYLVTAGLLIRPA